jgi:hypothetical protein
MNISNIIKLVACLAWGGVAVSSATPAVAKATTTQNLGSYGTCSNSSSTTYWTCGTETFNYTQTIKMLQTGCSSGTCSNVMDITYVDFLYGTGRKIVAGAAPCLGYGNYLSFGMGTCAC